MHVAFGRIRRRIALLQARVFVRTGIQLEMYYFHLVFSNRNLGTGAASRIHRGHVRGAMNCATTSQCFFKDRHSFKVCPLDFTYVGIFIYLTQLATYMILDARTPFFSEKRSFLRKTWRVSYHFRCEEPQANSLCYKEKSHRLTAYATKRRTTG